MIKAIKTIGFILPILFLCCYASAYDGSVHSVLNEKAAISSKLGDILKMQLGLDQGIKSEIFKDGETKKVFEWIAFGGKAEDFCKKGECGILDYPSTRAFNHFHNPLENWENAGLDNVALAELYKSNYTIYPVSAVLWSLKKDAQDFSNNTTGDWSWGNAKEAYYIYLTGQNFEEESIASTESDRNSYFADCFRSLGQVMHLLEDISVPLHTRKDAHIFPIGVMANLHVIYHNTTIL